VSNSKNRNKKKSKCKAIVIAVFLLISIVVVGFYIQKQNKTESSSNNTTYSQISKNSEQRNSAQCAQELPVEFLAGQVLMLGVNMKNIDQDTQLFKKYHIGGAVLMDSPSNQNLSIIKQFKKSGGSFTVPILISTDEEGGEVQRFSNLGKLPTPEYVASNMSTIEAQKLIEQHGKKLKAAGIDMILGPLADVSPNTGTGPLSNRVFSADPNIVAKYDKAYIQGWQDAGLYPTLKHFPGLGSATGNSDFQPSVTPPFENLVNKDLVPYKKLNKSGTAVMIGNQVVPNFTNIPASLSPTVNKYLRNDLGYKDNLIITDSLDAKAVTENYSEASAVVYALISGNDMAVDTAHKGENLSGPFIGSLTKAVVNAVENKYIKKQELAQSVSRKLSVQGLSACQIKINN